ncbi:glycosyltransferase family 2 protein [Paenibacillus sp. CMAA1739]|uniref:glycosyltransferase family 2 protein n=1 Tax=Paenibacillus ottowii TaxID=2315729 RepID=UPI00272F6ACD|nr:MULTISPECIES: glycosyltransferase family 2 protein [Paenibacillus]MDP1510162.1 glycosyltransferase family 2 protein [Paenibacillus ottowii]MEC4565578.1 glycosyltransferase family 2 protein [Paenibacillus sp. CMAA1739]
MGKKVLKKVRILVIIPAYNEEQNIKELINKFKKNKYDIIVINDCSTDNTSIVCKENGINVIDLPCNLGIGGAVQTGYKYAYDKNYDIAIQVDGDGQHDPGQIEKIITPILNNKADMVIGSRYIEKVGFQSTRIRRIGIKYFSDLIYVFTRVKITDPTSGFRACGRKSISVFANVYYPSDYPEPESIVHLIRTNHKVMEIPVTMMERQAGESSIKSVKSLYYMIKVSLAILIDLLREKKSYEVLQ